MSVDYKSALIYGYDCSHLINKISWEDLEELENIGWDYIRDPYSDKFLYIGVKISCVDCYEERIIDIFKALNPTIHKFSELIGKTPDGYKALLPLSGSVYHICYAT